MKPVHTQSLTRAGMWSGIIARGKRLRLTARADGANVGMLLYHAPERQETVAGCRDSNARRAARLAASRSFTWYGSI